MFGLAEQAIDGSNGREVAVGADYALNAGTRAYLRHDFINSLNGAYTLSSRVGLTLALVGMVFGASAILSVFNAFTAELFPTELRADAFAWANNLLGRIAYVAAPLAVGAAAEHVGWGPSVAVTAVGPLIAAAIAVTAFPETRGRELEEIAGH